MKRSASEPGLSSLFSPSFTSVSLSSSPRSYSFTTATPRSACSHCDAGEWQKPTILFQDLPGAVSLRYRNHAEIIVLVCEQKPYPSVFWVGAKAIWHRVNPGGVLPYMGYIGTCRGIGYGF